jgi:hypothetical protein
MQANVSRHYTHGSLIEAIGSGLASLGETAGAVTVDDLAPVARTPGDRQLTQNDQRRSTHDCAQFSLMRSAPLHCVPLPVIRGCLRAAFP